MQSHRCFTFFPVCACLGFPDWVLMNTKRYCCLLLDWSRVYHCKNENDWHKWKIPKEQSNIPWHSLTVLGWFGLFIAVLTCVEHVSNWDILKLCGAFGHSLENSGELCRWYLFAWMRHFGELGIYLWYFCAALHWKLKLTVFHYKTGTRDLGWAWRWHEFCH